METCIEAALGGLDLFPVWLLLGPRQVGKTSLLQRVAKPDRRWIRLDDLATRTLALEDPVFLLNQYPPPLAIDEIQFAPQLLSIIKLWVDEKKLSVGDVWLTGSQNFSVMKGVRESLAGRVAILNLFGLSDREKHIIPSAENIFRSILETSFPLLNGLEDENSRANYLSSYVQTYVERDVVDLGGVTKRREFELFLKMCALRTGQVVEYHSLARDAGISDVTARQWLGLLEDSFLISLVTPYHSNRTKRLIKNPKMYFCDAGLAAYLGGWRLAETLRLSPTAGALYETHIFGQILRMFRAQNREVQFHFWRTKDGQEVDLLVETGGKIYPVEMKLGTPLSRDLLALDRIAEANWQRGQVISPVDLKAQVHPDWTCVKSFEM